MSRTVSFRCSEELDEFLEKEAERRMTTKSAVAQMIVAEYATEAKGKPERGEDKPGEDPGSAGGDSADEEGQNGEMSELDEALAKYSEHWYESSGKKNYAVEPPEGTDKKRRYYKTKREAVKRLKKRYA